MKKKIIWNYKHYNRGVYRKCLACCKPKTYVFFMFTKIMDKNILGKRIIVCAKWALRKRRVNETIVCEKFYSLLSLRSLSNLFHIMKQRYVIDWITSGLSIDVSQSIKQYIFAISQSQLCLLQKYFSAFGFDDNVIYISYIYIYIYIYIYYSYIMYISWTTNYAGYVIAYL